MNIAFVGTGFVADYYMTTLKNFPQLRLTGVFDRAPERLKEFSAFHHVQTYDNAEAVMRDPAIATASTQCAYEPAPPDAMTGTSTDPATVSINSRS